MKKFKLLSVVLSSLILCSCQQGNSQNPAAQPSEQTGALYVYKNLAIWLIQGEDQVGRKYVTLEEAMDKKYIVLHETGSVNQLSVDNKSDKYVFILSGDIVKGGKQDRTIGSDIILEPGCKNVPLESFCVEQSRWRQRGDESSAEFSSSKKMLSNKNLKIAARSEKEQGKVWKEVADFQEETAKNINKEVKSSVSATSLQLTLENKDLQSATKEYLEAIEPFFKGKKDVLGFGFCINGKISTIDVFGNADLFAKLKDKLLESAVNEAVSQYNEKTRFENPSKQAIQTFITAAEKGDETITVTGKNTMEKRYKTDKSIMFKTINQDASENPVHLTIYSVEK